MKLGKKSEIHCEPDHVGIERKSKSIIYFIWSFTFREKQKSSRQQDSFELTIKVFLLNELWY